MMMKVTISPINSRLAERWLCSPHSSTSQHVFSTPFTFNPNKSTTIQINTHEAKSIMDLIELLYLSNPLLSINNLSERYYGWDVYSNSFGYHNPNPFVIGDNEVSEILSEITKDDEQHWLNSLRVEIRHSSGQYYWFDELYGLEAIKKIKGILGRFFKSYGKSVLTKYYRVQRGLYHISEIPFEWMSARTLHGKLELLESSWGVKSNCRYSYYNSGRKRRKSRWYRNHLGAGLKSELAYSSGLISETKNGYCQFYDDEDNVYEYKHQKANRLRSRYAILKEKTSLWDEPRFYQRSWKKASNRKKQYKKIGIHGMSFRPDIEKIDFYIL